VQSGLVGAAFQVSGMEVWLWGPVWSVEPTGQRGAVAIVEPSGKPDDPYRALRMRLTALVIEQMAEVAVEEIIWQDGGEVCELFQDAGRTDALRAIERGVELAREDGEPWAPLAPWCRRCPHHDECHDNARRAREPSLVHGLSARTAHALRGEGVLTVEELAKTDADLVASLPYGARRVGSKRAATFIERAAAHAAGAPRWSQDHTPLAQRLGGRLAVAFDVEADATRSIVLWGLRVPGESESRIIDAGTGLHADREGWRRFLAEVEAVRAAVPDCWFVHWGHYDRTAVQHYGETYGGEGIDTLTGRLFDVYGHFRSIALPLKSYSQKSVEDLAGVKRTLPGRDGLWASSELTRAAVLADPGQRPSAIVDVLTYLGEDLRGLTRIVDWAERERL